MELIIIKNYVYFVINKKILYSTLNINFHNKLKNCYYVKRKGSNVCPIFMVSIKENNTWICNNKLIGNYIDFMNFISSNLDKTICITGMSRAYMGEFIRNINYFKDSNILPNKRKAKILKYPKNSN